MAAKFETAVYKVNLHCHQCACEIKKPLLRTEGTKLFRVRGPIAPDFNGSSVYLPFNGNCPPDRKEEEKLYFLLVGALGFRSRKRRRCCLLARLVNYPFKVAVCIQGVHQVEFDLEKNEVKVKGSIDAVAIHKRIERLCKRKVEMISPKGAVKEVVVATEKKVVAKETVVVTENKTVAKETKEVATRTIQVKAYMHCDQCERDLRTKLLRHRGIFSVKTDMKSQTLTVQGSIENDKLLRYIQNRVNKRAEIIPPPPKAVVEKTTVVEKTKVKTVTSPAIYPVEFKEEKKVEIKTAEGNPYFIHYVYAPQTFSDENPNACSVM